MTKNLFNDYQLDSPPHDSPPQLGSQLGSGAGQLGAGHDSCFLIIGIGNGKGKGNGKANNFLGFNKIERAAIFLIFWRTLLFASFLCGAKVTNKNKVTSKMNEIFKQRIFF